MNKEVVGIHRQKYSINFRNETALMKIFVYMQFSLVLFKIKTDTQVRKNTKQKKIKTELTRLQSISNK